MDAELDAKADKSQVDSKVSRTVFDSTIGDLQKMIDDLLSKLLAYVSHYFKVLSHGSYIVSFISEFRTMPVTYFSENCSYCIILYCNCDVKLRTHSHENSELCCHAYKEDNPKYENIMMSYPTHKK